MRKAGFRMAARTATRFSLALIPAVALLSCISRTVVAQSPGLGASAELVDPKTFRVCAAPRNLPFSYEAGKGFENKLAELLASKLAEPISYTYYPQVIGFVRNTLNALRCDVVMGAAVGDDLMQTTVPYYHTTYALVFGQQRIGQHRLVGGSAIEDPAYRYVPGCPRRSSPSRAVTGEALCADRRYQDRAPARR